ncbi:hypothetical protein EXIGLDRAFT_726870 [Exidia glandulosa HHB12029]|uniref:Uncharacterized protein n=1 Tax=Exidia glandulosa HHB12029 TaxID=1314781 RepID=A0A165DJT0_EXIGL|nr:hypothetical protein EXIGLDRAFT_726870 [Exidia glandulosa HHB12029]
MEGGRPAACAASCQLRLCLMLPQHFPVEHARRIPSAQVVGWFNSTWGAVHEPSSTEPAVVLNNVAQRRNVQPLAASIDASVIPTFTTFSAPELVPGVVPSGGFLLLPEYHDLYRDFTAWLDPDLRAESFQPRKTDCACSDSSGLFETTVTSSSQFTVDTYGKCFFPKAFHVYGSHGTGMSIALYYLLLRRTLLHHPTVFITKNKTFYICEDGVFELCDLDLGDYWAIAVQDDSVLLFDSDHASDPTMAWVFQRTLPILEARSPGGYKNSWSDKVTDSVVVWWYRPPCIWHALAAALLHLHDPDIDELRLNQAYSRWGPSISNLVRDLNDRDERRPHYEPEQLRRVLAAKDKNWLLMANFTHPIHFDNEAALLSCGDTREDVRVTLSSPYLLNVLRDSASYDLAGSIDVYPFADRP